MPPRCTTKVIILGDSGVGKSSLMARFLENRFSPEAERTIGVEFGTRMVVSPNARNVKLCIWDTAGHEKYRSIIKSYYRKSNCVVMVYDVSNTESFDSVEQYWFREVSKNVDSSARYFVVGNKSDKTRTVNPIHVDVFCKKHSIRSIETSAKHPHNVENLFNAVGCCDLNHPRDEALVYKCDGLGDDGFNDGSCLHRLCFWF